MQRLDFNAIAQPTWEVQLRDEAKTVVVLTAPDVDLVDRLTALGPDLRKATESKDGGTIKAVYGLIAELMSRNEDGYTFTAEELRDRYNMRLLDVFRFVAGYMEFIKEIQGAPN